MMAIYKCLVNGSIAEETRRRVVTAFEQITVDHFGPDPDGVDVQFVEVAAGAWFTAGEPSSASTVLGTVPAGTCQHIRTALMDDIANAFSAATNSDLMKVMIVAADAKSRS